MRIAALAPQASPLTSWVILQMRPSGIEPESMLWKSTILPLNYERINWIFFRRNPNSKWSYRDSNAGSRIQSPVS